MLATLVCNSMTAESKEKCRPESYNGLSFLSEKVLDVGYGPYSQSLE